MNILYFILYIGFWKGTYEQRCLDSYFGDKSIIQSMLDEMKGILRDITKNKKEFSVVLQSQI